MDNGPCECCRSAIGEAEGANEEGFYPESSRSLDSLRRMRLVALLHDMVDDDGKVKAAKTLGVNHRTVSRAVESATMTERMSDALERHLLLGGSRAAPQQRKRVETLEERLVALEEELRGSLEAVVGEVKALREDHARATRHVERRLRRLEAGMNGSEMSSHVSVEPESSKRRYVRPRTYPQLVTQQAEPDENLVYGDATPVIVEWRKARDEYLRTLKTGTVLDRAEAEQPMLQLEIAIIEEHELTLPPASYSWGWEDRQDQVRRRRQSLGDARVERNRALSLPRNPRGRSAVSQCGTVKQT